MPPLPSPRHLARVLCLPRTVLKNFCVFFSVHRDACGSLFVAVDLTGLEVHVCGLHTCLVLTPSPALPEPWQPGARLTSNPPALNLYGRGLLLQPYPNAPPSARTLSLVARHTDYAAAFSPPSPSEGRRWLPAQAAQLTRGSRTPLMTRQVIESALLTPILDSSDQDSSLSCSQHNRP